MYPQFLEHKYNESNSMLRYTVALQPGPNKCMNFLTAGDPLQTEALPVDVLSQYNEERSEKERSKNLSLL